MRLSHLLRVSFMKEVSEANKVEAGKVASRPRQASD